jgi:hypothetical protein
MQTTRQRTNGNQILISGTKSETTAAILPFTDDENVLIKNCMP